MILKINFRILSIFFLCIWLTIIKSQTAQIDSLKQELVKARQDTQICKLYYEIGRKFFDQYSDSAFPYFEKAISIAEQRIKSLAKSTEQNSLLKSCANCYKGLALIAEAHGENEKAEAYYEKGYELYKLRNDERGMADMLNNIGNSYDHLGAARKALQYYSKSLELRRKINNIEGIGQSLSNMGNSYSSLGNISKALECYTEAIKVLKNSNFKKEYAYALLSLSYMYSQNGDIPKALECIEQSLELNRKRGDKNEIAASLVEMGNIYFRNGNYKKANSIYQDCLAIYEQVGNFEQAAGVYNSIAGVYFMSGDITNAAKWLKKSMEVYEKSGNKNMLATSYGNLGEIYSKKGETSKAIGMFQKAKQIGLEIHSPARIKDAAEALFQIYKSSGNYQKALENHELLIKMKDSIDSESNRKSIMKAQLRYEYEKKAAADSVAHAKQTEVKNAELARQNAEIRASRNQRYALIGGLTLVMIFAAVMYNRFKVTNKQKTIIGKQKILVEEKQKEILDSISYAGRIQRALLPGEKYIIKNLERLKKIGDV